MALKFVTSEKGKPKLLFDGHLYYKDKEVDVNKIYWKCENYRKVKCVARLVSEGDHIIKKSGDHNHVADAANVEGGIVMSHIRENAKHTQDAPQLIISNASVGLSSAAATTFAKVSSIKRTIRNVRTKHQNLPVLPIHRRDIIFPEEYTR